MTRINRLRARGSIAVGCAALALAGLASSAEAKTHTIASYAKAGTVASGGGYIALTQADTSGAQILVGKIGEVPQVVGSLSGAPSWARLHFGTTAAGRVVLVWPTCSAGDCDLHAYDPASGQDQALSGAASTDSYELEGDLDRGALAFSVRLKELPSIVSTDIPAQRLRYRAAGGAVRTLTDLGGSFIEMDRGRILSARSVLGGAEGGGECGAAILELTRVNGTRQRVGRQGCGENFQMIAGAGFVSRGTVAWGVSTVGDDLVRITRLRGTHREKPVRVPGGFESYAPINASAAVVLRGTTRLDLNPDPEFAPPVYTLERVTGIRSGN